jgi:hypothetical protein
MATEKDWEKHARKSRHSAFMSFIGALVVVGALAFSFFQLRSLDVQKKQKLQELSQLNEQIDKKYEELGELILAVQDSVKKSGMEDAEKAVGDVIASYNLIKTEKKVLDRTVEKALADERPLKKKPAPAEMEMPASSAEEALIATDENFVLCRAVQSMNPVDIGNSFAPGRVYVWSRIQTPKDESLVLRWVGADEQIVRTSYLRVTKNMQNGFRVYDFKTFRAGDVGDYQVRLYNGAGEMIAERSFDIK